jgi:hypothetical protein
VSNRIAQFAHPMSFQACFSGPTSHQKKSTRFDTAARSAAFARAERPFVKLDQNSVGA